MATVGVNVIETAALGRPFQLGMLYDCRKDALIPGITLWDEEKLQQSLRVRPQINSDIKVTASDSIQEKSALLNIDGSLKLSVLAGLVNVTGAAKYLNDTKKSFKQKRLSLHYHSTSRFEELSMNNLAPENIVHHEVFDNDAATHVVTAVLYGADACFVFDREVSSDEEIKTVEEEAKMAFEKLKLISVDANANLKMNDTQKYAVRKFTCTFYGDVQLPSNPTSFEGALKAFTDLPKLLGEKKALAVPLRVWLFPLDKLLSKASKLQKDISMDLFMAIESVIESLNTIGMKSNDLLKDSPASTFAAFHDKILQMKQNCYMYKLRLMKKLGSLLPIIRGDVMKETALNDLLEEHNESPFSESDLAEWLKERERESDVIKMMLRQLGNAQVEDNMDLISMFLGVGNMVCYTFTSLNWSDMLLLQQKAYLSPLTKGKNENSPDPEQKSWLTPEILQTLRSNLKIFKNLIGSKERKQATFFVSSKEMKNNPGSCILLYESECEEAVCFIPPSKPACPISEEVKDNSVVLKVPPSCPETVELRLLYKQKRDTVWRSKPVLKDQLTVTLTDLTEDTEYEIRCAALGKLNYTMYSDVTEVVTEGKGSLNTGIDFKGEGHSIPSTTSESCWSPGPHQSCQLSETFKLRLMEELRYLNEEISPGRRQLLNDVFIERHITEEPDSHFNNNKEIISNNIFETRTVLMKGEAGIGKTVTVQKFILDWAEEKSNHDIEYIFLIPFQKLNIIRETVKKCGFMELLQRCCENTEHLNPESRIMLIFDGLNEFKVPLDFQTTKKIKDPNIPASVSDLLTNLMMGNLLPNARIWITSRPAAANQIPAGFIDRVTEIQGFDDEQKEEYFRKSISDPIMADKVISHIQKSPRINSMCYSPDYCRIIAAIPEEVFSTGGSDFPKTLTQMYSKLLLAQTEPIPERREAVIALGRIAFDMLVNANSLFCEDKLSAERVKASSSIIKVIDEKRKSFCFVSPRTQEFLAALYATDVINGGNPLPLRDLSSLNLELGEQSFTHYDSLQKVMNIALKKQMDLFFCFLLGFRLESSQIALKGLLTQRSSSSSQEIIQHIKTMVMNSSSENAVECSLLFDCVKELDDRYLIQEIKTQLKSGLRLSPDQSSALMSVLLNSEEKRDETKYHQSEELKLRPVVKTSGEHELRSCGISDGGCAVLSSALISNPSLLRELDLSENNITDSEMKQLSDLLEHPQCKLEKLELRSCGISDGGCADLSSALRSNLSLRELDLSGNNITDSGVMQLLALLEHPQCKLQKLGLRSFHISDGGCAVLSSALRLNPAHLRELDLSENNITELGVKMLSALLADTRCKLEKLGLRSCGISDGGCADLRSALRSNLSLRELDLSENNITEAGVNQLSALLEHRQCKLQKLGLRSCRVSDGSWAYLSSALISNPSLRELDLSKNNITKAGVKRLSDLLAHHQCKLEKLGLRSCQIKDGGCADLSSALRSNPSLRELDLSKNDITDLGIKQLSELLAHPQCKLEKLEIRSCYISNGGCADLSSALRSNPSLRELDLSENNITDLGIKQLSDLLKHPQCKLEKLRIRSCYISNGGCADLSSALRSNPSHLRELDLSENNITDSGIKQLSDLLKDPRYKLEKLGHYNRLRSCGIRDGGFEMI